MNGIINIKKETGYTSHDVVARLRRILSTKRVGHTGTLDPEAEGVLPICVGYATKVAELLTASEKEYVARVALGAETDTQDGTGTILQQAEVTVSEEEIRQVAQGFVGEISQIPPMYSAIKQNGKKLYELARAGIEVERKPRQVRIFALTIEEINLEKKEFTMRVRCSKGTYIRTLCQDMGRALGCYGYMAGLCRTQSGRFHIEEALTLDAVAAAVAAEDFSFLRPVDVVFEECPLLYLSQEKATKMAHGVRVRTTGLVDGTRYRVYDEKGRFLALARGEHGVLVVEKAFYQDYLTGGDQG